MFDFNCTVLVTKEIQVPSNPTPGLVTIILSKLIEEIDPLRISSLVLILVPEDFNIQSNQRRISIDNISGWCDVPLLDWLEYRLNKQIVIRNLKSLKNSLSTSSNSSSLREQKYLLSEYAARFAIEYFGSPRDVKSQHFFRTTLNH